MTHTKATTAFFSIHASALFILSILTPRQPPPRIRGQKTPPAKVHGGL
jgi:hypothetical protein